MKIVCDSCSAKYSIADEKVAGKVFKIRCKKCSSVIVVRGDQVAQPAEEQAQAQQPAYDYGGEAVWHVVVDGDQQGPFAPAQLGQMLTEGSIDWEAYVWREGFDGWKPARDIPDLIEAITGEPQGGQAPAAAEPAAAAATAAAGGGLGADPFGGGADPYAQPAEPAADPYAQPAADPYAQQPAADPYAAPAADPYAAPAAAATAPDGGGGLFGGVASGGEADLFAAQDPAASPFGGGDVVASGGSPRVSAEDAMTGARNENSVLFSLSNLQALATGAPSGGGAGAAAPAPSMNAGHASGEGSGLIDIRALASAASSVGAASPAPVAATDDLLNIGGGPALGGLGAPVLAPVAVEPEKSKTGLILGAIAAATLVIGLIVALVVVLMQKPDPVATANPTATAAPAPAPAAPAAAPAAAAPAAPTGAAPTGTAAQPTGAAPTQPAEDTAEEEDDSSDSSRRRRRRRSGSSSSGSSTPSATPTASPMAAAAASPMRASRMSSGDIDDLLDAALSGSSSMRSSMMSAPAMMSESLPATPPRDAVRRALQGVAGRVRACKQGQSGIAQTAITFIGSTGRVGSARVTGQFAGTPVGSCVARAVRGARVPRFSRDRFPVNFPYRL